MAESQMLQFTDEQLRWATGVVGRHVPPTAQYVWPMLAESIGAEIWVKHENHTPTGAFKVRGGLVYTERLRTERPEVKGIVSATRGNHGQSLAFAGRATGVKVTIVVPEGNSPDKNAAMRAFGAELIVHGHDFQAAREHAEDLGKDRGLEVVPSFHPDLVLGVATYANELFAAAGELELLGAGVRVSRRGRRSMLGPSVHLLRQPGLRTARGTAGGMHGGRGRGRLSVETPTRWCSVTRWATRAGGSS